MKVSPLWPTQSLLLVHIFDVFDKAQVYDLDSRQKAINNRDKGIIIERLNSGNRTKQSSLVEQAPKYVMVVTDIIGSTC